METERMRSHVETWTNGFSTNEELTEKVRRTITRLGARFIDENDAYAAEKFIKTFWEHISTFRSMLQYQEGVARRDLRNMSRTRASSKDLKKASQKLSEIDERVEAELKRQTRHWNSFIKASS